LIAKVVGGKALEAFDRYYADDVTMQENEQPPRVGKAACRAFEEDFLSKIKTVRTYVCDVCAVRILSARAALTDQESLACQKRCTSLDRR
jgi:ketosteroid isomerase-like protein